VVIGHVVRLGQRTVGKELVRPEAELEAELEAKAEAPQEVDENEEDDTVPQALEPTQKRTIVSEGILPKRFLLNDTAIEDSLFEETNLNKEKVMKLAHTQPLNSHILGMNINGYEAVKNHIESYEKKTKQNIQDSVAERDELTYSSILNATRDLTRCNMEVVRCKEDLKNSQQMAAASDKKLQELEARKEDLVVDIQRMEKGVEVADVMKKSMEQLSVYHAIPQHKAKYLPLGDIMSELDPELIAFKEKCNLTDFASTDLLQRELMAISRAATMLGFQYSPYFRNNGCDYLCAGKIDRYVQRQQICKAFKIAIPHSIGNGAAAKSPNRKRKKRCKEDDEQIYGAIVNSPAVLEIYKSPPQLKKKRALPKSGDGN